MVYCFRCFSVFVEDMMISFPRQYTFALVSCIPSGKFFVVSFEYYVSYDDQPGLPRTDNGRPGILRLPSVRLSETKIQRRTENHHIHFRIPESHSRNIRSHVCGVPRYRSLDLCHQEPHLPQQDSHNPMAEHTGRRLHPHPQVISCQPHLHRII